MDGNTRVVCVLECEVGGNTRVVYAGECEVCVCVCVLGGGRTEGGRRGQGGDVLTVVPPREAGVHRATKRRLSQRLLIRGDNQ